MTKFADQLFDDLMQEHGSESAGLLVPGSSSPAYAATANPNGTVTLDVYDQAGIAGANAALRKLGKGQVVVVPVQAGCPSITSLPLVSGDADYLPFQNNVSNTGNGSVSVSMPGGGHSVNVSGKGIPKGDVDLVLVQATSKDMLVWGRVVSVTSKGATVAADTLTKAPAPSCVSVPESAGGSAAPAK